MEKHKGLEVQDLGDEIAIFVKETREVHFLNELAAEIWKMTSRGSDEDQILEELREEYPGVNTEILKSDLKKTLESLRHIKVI